MPSLQLSTLKVPTTSAPWSMIGRCSGGGKITAKDGSLRVDYIEGEVGSDSGVTFHAQPAKFPAAECTLSYQVFFNEHFDWKEGGKLPGLYVGGVGASGGNWSDDCGSARIVFKQGGAAVAYVYVPLQVCGGKDDRHILDKVEGPAFANVVQHTTKGTHVWRDGTAGTFKRGAWNDVHLHLKMNDPGAKDGVLELGINGKVTKLPFVWRTSKKCLVEGIAFATFFGGSTKDAAAPKNASCEFRNFTYII
jgi:hypothetical protein